MEINAETKSGAKINSRVNHQEKRPLQDLIPLETPFSIHIDVCSFCNFRCSFCFHGDPKAKEKGLKTGYMPMELFKKIVDDMTEFPERVKKLKIGNHGEPTLHKELPEMIAYAREKNVADIIEVFTNGSKLTPELNEKLVKAGLQRINVSIEGMSEEIYKAVAGVKIDMEKMKENLKNLYETRNKHCTDKDFSIYIKIADQTKPLDKNDNSVFAMSEEDKENFYNSFGSFCDEIYVEKIVPQWADTQEDKQNDVGETGMYGQATKKWKAACPFIYMYLQFNWDGTTSPCTLDWPRKVDIGDVTKQSVKEIWHGKALRDLQIKQLQGERHKIPFCKDCSAPMVCVKDDIDDYSEPLLEKLRSLPVS